jgi:DNA topoisomerase IA
VLSARRVQTAAVRLLMQIYLRLNADERSEAFHSSAKIEERAQEFSLNAWSISTNSRRRTAVVESKAQDE